LRFAWEAGVPLTDTGTLAVDDMQPSAVEVALLAQIAHCDSARAVVRALLAGEWSSGTSKLRTTAASSLGINGHRAMVCPTRR
jgi:hypothetical protein